jgi:hypothetical protein
MIHGLMLRRSSFVVSLAGRRLARRFRTVLLAALGIAAGAATLVSVLGAGAVAQDQSLARALAKVPPEQRVIRAAWYGTSDPGIDPIVRRALRGISSDPPIRAMMAQQTNVGGALFNLGAVDRLDEWVRLRSGRLPRGCSAQRCEVLQVAGSGPIPNVPGLRLRRVGLADLVSSVPFLQTTAYGRAVDQAYSFTSPSRAPPFLLTNDLDGAATLPLLRLTHRSYGWILPLQPGSVHPWTIDGLAGRVERTRSALTTRSAYLDLADPLSQLAPTVSANRVTARRLLLVGGEAVAVLLAFVVLVAASGRREAEATRSRLARFGAQRWQIGLLTLVESGAVALLASLVGWVVGLGVTAAIAATGEAPVSGVLTFSVASAGGLWLALGVALVATAVLVFAQHAPAIRPAGFSLTALDMAALGALVAITLSLVRGAADAEALAQEGGPGVLLFLLPALIAFVAAVAAVRLLGPAVRLLERAGRRMPVSGRLAALSLARNPGYAGAAAAFLLVSIGLAAFSLDYRSTLSRAQSDQARFATPPDAVLSTKAGQRVSLADPRLAAAYAGTAERTVPVLRLDAQQGAGATSRQVSLLGLPVEAVRTLPFWRGDFASSTLGGLAAAVDPGRPFALRGVRLPQDTRELRLAVRSRGEPVRLTASIATLNGIFIPVDLTRIEPGRKLLTGQVPPAARGGLLVGLAFAQTEPDVHGATPASGSVVLGPISSRGRTRTRVLPVDFGDWQGVGGIHVQSAGQQARLTYFVSTDADSRLRPRQPSDQGYVPAIATPQLASIAGPGGLLPLRVGGVSLVVRIAATAKRFPSVYGEFVVADRTALATALNAVAPGSAVVHEVWLEGSSGHRAQQLASAVGRPPLVGVQATFQSAVAARLRDDPLAQAVLRTLAALGIVGSVLALAGLGLTLAADLRDELGELSDLEAQGAGPATLRRHVRLRSSGVLALGVLGGVALAVVLSVLVAGIVQVTANGGLPEPPLQLTVDVPLLLVGLVAYLVCAAGLVSIVTSSAFRAPGRT